MKKIDEVCDISTDNQIFKNSNTINIPCSRILKCLNLIFIHNKSLCCCKKNLNDNIVNSKSSFSVYSSSNLVLICDTELNEDKFLHYIFNYNKYCNNYIVTLKDRIIRAQIREFCMLSESLNFDQEIITEKIVFSNVLKFLNNKQNKDEKKFIKQKLDEHKENIETTVIPDIYENNTSQQNILKHYIYEQNLKNKSSVIILKNSQDISNNISSQVILSNNPRNNSFSSLSFFRFNNTSNTDGIKPIYFRNRIKYLALKDLKNIEAGIFKDSNKDNIASNPIDSGNLYFVGLGFTLFGFFVILFLVFCMRKVNQWWKNKNLRVEFEQ